jgi:hypothetical protein
MSKVVKLSMLGATGAVMFLAAPIGGTAALAGPVGLAAASSVSLPAATDSVAYRRWRHEGRSAAYCPPRRLRMHRSAAVGCCEGRTVYVRRIIERRTAYVVQRPRYIVERRTAYVAAPVATAVAVPVVAAAYPAYGYGYGGYGPGAIGAGLLGGVLNVGLGGWGGGWGPGWGYRRGWW